jgi:hypothetical protein
VNIEFIVAMLLRSGKLGGFDFNSRFYADDDLMAGAADPFQLFRIMFEVVKEGALGPDSGVAFMLDQCYNIEPKIAGQIRSVMNVQEATAKALLVDMDALRAAQHLSHRSIWPRPASRTRRWPRPGPAGTGGPAGPAGRVPARAPPAGPPRRRPQRPPRFG